MASRCRKFTPNLFNKSKCQSCFGAKESHSAEALESSKAARKISKCTYLFVSPDLDFSNPLHRTKRWQRRFFVLYDDGEFTYSVDDNPGTVPQGSVDMNKCTDVFDAEESTGHEYSIGVLVPGTATIYVKGTSKDEIKRWFDVLVMYPRSLTVKNKRSSVGKTGAPLSRNLSYFPQTNDKAISDDEDDVGHSKDTDLDRSGRTRGRFKQRDVRRSKSEVRPSDLKLAEDEYNKKTVDTIKLSLPAPLPADNLVIAAKEKTEDILPSQTRKLAEPETFSSVRSMKQKKNKNVLNNEKQKAEPVASAPIPSVPTSMTTSSINSINSTLESQPFDIPQTVESPVINRRLSTPNITTNGLNHKPVSRTLSTSAKLQESSVPTASAFTFSAVPPTNLPIEANETDEHKIAKSEHAKKSIEKSPTVRKGWLLVRDAVSWSKHWFVLCGTKLSYYKDPKAEETNELDGAIDVASAFEVSSVKTERNHGFKIKTKEGEYTLSAMTSGIRRNWVEAVEIIINDKKRASEKSSRQDMGFVYESPRTPRTPAAVGVPALPPILEPVVPDSSSRINNVLREVAERHREVADEPQPESPFSELEMHNPMRNDMECPEECPEVSGLTSTMDQTDGIPSSGKVVPESPQSPKSPSSFVSPSLRIKEKSRSKTPPRVKSPPPPSSLPVSSASSVLSSVSSELSSLIASGGSGSSDENDETLHAKLLDSQKQVQHLQQQLQDSNSSVRKQRVEIESLQTKLDLTTTQLHEMETALTHSAQNLNKERKNVARLNEAFERLKTDNTPNAELLQKYLKLEKQLHEVTSRMSLQEAKVTMMNSLEEQLQQNLMKISTLETMYATAQSQLERTVENLQQTKVHYQKRIEEMESAFGVERAELLDNLQAAEDKLSKSTTVSSNSANSEFTSDSLRDKLKYIKQLEEQLKEQQVMMEQLQEQCTKYINKENFAVDQSNRFTERITLQKDLDQLKLDMRKAAEVHQQEKEELKKTNAVRTQELANSNKQLKEYMDKCKNLENTLKSTSTSLTPSQPTESTGDYYHY